MRKEGNEIVINGHKWYASGAGDPRCAVYLVMGKSDPDNASPHKQQSVVLVPAGTPGVTVVRQLGVFGYDDAPHGHSEIVFKNVRVPLENLVLGWGRGFEIIQGRLGCVALVGLVSLTRSDLCADLAVFITVCALSVSLSRLWTP